MLKCSLNKQGLAILIYSFFGFLSCSYSQSKKEQIELLSAKFDSLSAVHLSEREECLKEIEKLKFDLQNIKSERDSFSGKNEQLNNQIQLFKTEVEKRDNQIKMLRDSISSNSYFQILSFWIEEEIEIMTGPIIQVDYAVLQVSDKSIKGFVGWASQGEASYYIVGDFMNGSYIGDVFSVGCDEDCNTSLGKFQLKIENLKLKLTGAATVGHDEIPSYNGMHFFYGEPVTDLLVDPKMGSKVLMPKTSINDDTGVEVLEIGKFEKINGEYNLWFKVKIKGVTGWVFGGLCTVCPNSTE